MRALTTIGLGLVSAFACAGTAWCPNLPVALTWAKRTHKPILIAGMNPMRSVGYLLDESFLPAMDAFVPVEASSYEEVVQICPQLPRGGTPSVVILDSRGKLLKRLNGPIRPGDLAVTRRQVDWLMRQGDSVLRTSARANADGDAFADAATVLAMRGNPAAAQQKATIAVRKGASAPRLVPAFEALADEARVAGEMKEASRLYRVALGFRPSPPTEMRLRLRLANTLFRNGEPAAAIEEARTVLSHNSSTPEDQEYARRFLDRIGTAPMTPFGAPPLPPPRIR